MAEETTTKPTSGDAVADSPELQKLEQVINEAVSEDSPDTSSDEQASADAPDVGQAFQELAQKKGFKSVDDMAKAYQNLESQSTRLSQEMRELAKEVKQINAPQPDDPYKDLPNDQKQALELLGRVIDERLDSKLSPLRQDLETRNAQSEIDAVKGRYPGVDDIAIDQAISVVEKHPSLSLDEAVKIVTYEQAKSAGEAQRKKTDADSQKTRAFVESSKTAKTGGNVDYSKLSLEELENILPKSGEYIDYKGILRK